MSKRASVGQSNTLFNYFQSPKDKAQIKNGNENTNGNSNHKKSTNTNESDDEIQPIIKKRNRLTFVDSDSDNETVNTPKKTSKSTAKKRKLSKDSDNEDNNLKSFSFDKSARDLNKSESLDASTSNEKSLTDNWLHNRLDFLKPEHIRDINKNRLQHPDYDEKTLYVPDEFLNKQTPAMRQWWILKSNHFDTVLFFKVGKFYEFYHMDAVVGVNNLGFSYMKGDFAHSGFPEIAYDRMASSLIEQGFKVGRIEQTETPEMMAERCRAGRSTKFDKVVNREICQISTQATCVYGAQMTEAKQPFSYYMLAIAEKPQTGGTEFGVCFTDTTVGTFFMGQFEDDKHCSRLLNLLAQHPPSLILIERGRLQQSTSEILNTTFAKVKKDALKPNSQFLSGQTTIDLLAEGSYFRDKNDQFEWPPVLSDFIEWSHPKLEYELVLKAFGACVWYLKDSELDIQMLSMKKFNIYQPADLASDKDASQRDFMVLDYITIENLSLLGAAGTLQKTLDYCDTAFGKRLLQQWICRPLCRLDIIIERQEAVEELYQNNEIRQAARTILKKLPDLERQVSKIHTFGNRLLGDHPDSRAVFYESKTYSKRKILDLMSTIQGFERAQEMLTLFQGCNSKLLKKLTQRPPEGKFLDVIDVLYFFRTAFDQKEAENEGKIIPKRGIDDDFDEAEQEILDVQRQSKEYLEELEEMFKCKISYFGTDKKRFQIEIPENRTHKVTRDFQLEGSKKGAKPVKRYSTATSRKILADMIRAETKRNKIVQDLNRRIFEKFSDSRPKWEQVIHCLMMLDVLCSFAEYATNCSHSVCFPTVVPFQNEAYINIRDGIHPCTLLEDFVPNSTEIGTEDKEEKIMLLTGPNMGGKSTLMRQVALIVIMAQMGCPVPATSCEFTLVDRIFTRFGVNDDILRGQSTFLLELSEAASILKHATPHSFVLLDELGRGTSTHDGNAIATAYLKKLIEMQCRTIFSTHYHSLVEYYSGKSEIQLAHMACMTEYEGDSEGNDDPMQSVTLLYQLKEGNCPKSYGFNVAKLAGLPWQLIEDAHTIATELEKISIMRKRCSELMLCESAAEAREILNVLTFGSP